MAGRRTKDRWTGALLGALGMLVVLAVSAGVALWLLTEPTGSSAARTTAAGPGSSSPPTGPPAGPPTSSPGRGGATAAPPPDLAPDETWLADLVLEAGTVVLSDSLLRDVTAVGSDVRTGPDGAVAGSLAVEATVPFEVVAAEIGPDTTLDADGSLARVERTLDLVGRELRVVATGSVDVASGAIVVTPRTVDIGGPRLLARTLGGVARQLVTIEHTLEGLPEGLVLQDVAVREDGFRAELQGEDVRLAP